VWFGKGRYTRTTGARTFRALEKVSNTRILFKQPFYFPLEAGVVSTGRIEETRSLRRFKITNRKEQLTDAGVLGRTCWAG